VGVFAGPEITNDGLVLSLDAGNLKGFDDDENLLTYSNFSFSSITAYPTGWTSFNPGRVVRSIGQSPDGTDAAIVGKQFGNSGGFRPTSVTLSTSTNYTVSFYARKPTDSELSLFLSYFPTNDFTTQPYTKGVKIRYDDVDTSTGSTGSTSFTLTDTWQRFTYTFNSGSDTAISPNFTSLTVADAYDSNGLFVIASVQVERGSSASPYYATTASAKIRGTTLIDMTGRGNTGTLTNGPTYNSSNGGSIVFDGTNDYVTLPTNLLIHETGNPFTFSIWFKTSSTGIILGQQNNPTPNAASGYVPAIYVGTDGLLYTSCFWGGSTGNQSVSLSSVNNGSWNNITVTFASNSQISYLNGVSYATLSKTQTNYSSTYYYFLGSGQGASWTNFPASPYLNGSISNFSYYNRALTASEIRQNYNATKGRYGL